MRHSPLPLAIAALLLAVAGSAHAAAPPVDFDLQGFVDSELARGEKTIVVPPGRYRVAPRDHECLGLRGLTGVRLVCDGVEMVCTETTRALTVAGCSDVTVRGLSIDYDPLPFTQGHIVGLSADKSVHEIELLEGYPTSDAATTFKYEVFRPDTRTYRCGEYGIGELERLDARHLRITRLNASASDPEEVGDIVALGAEYAPGGSIPHAVYVVGCRGVRLESLAVYASNCFAFLEEHCDGTTYYRCRIDRRPLEDDLVARGEARVRSLNADAFHSISAGVGPSYLECSARFMGDDCINICGDYHLVTSSAGRVLRVLSKQRDGIDLMAGEGAELLAYSGLRLPDASIVSVEADLAPTAEEVDFIARQGMDAGLKEQLARARAYRVTLDREVDLPMGSAIASTARMGNGFVVRGCEFGFNRSRGILVKASDGVIEGNRLEGNVMSAIMLAPEWWWLESGSGSNVRIVDNEIRDCGDIAIAVYAFGGAPGLAPPGAHSGITVRGNRIVGCPLPNILITSTRDLVVEANTSSSWEGRSTPEWTRYRFGLLGAALAPTMLLNCEAARREPAG